MKRLALVLLASGTAWADTPKDSPAEIEVDRDATPPGRTELGFDGGAALDAWGVSVGAAWLDEPIALDGAHPVRRRETLRLGGAIVLGDTVVIDALVGGSHQVGDPHRQRFVWNDTRLGVRLRVAGSPERAAFLRGELVLPTGDDHEFAGDARWSGAWSLIGRITIPAGIVLAATTGIRLRGAEVLVGDRIVGDELFGAAGVVVPIPPIEPLWCTAEQVKLTAELAGALGDSGGAASGPAGGRDGPHPLELRVGIVTEPLPELTFGARVGVGLDAEPGAPTLRATVELSWAPRLPPAPPKPPEPEPEDEPD